MSDSCPCACPGTFVNYSIPSSCKTFQWKYNYIIIVVSAPTDSNYCQCSVLVTLAPGHPKYIECPGSSIELL